MEDESSVREDRAFEAHGLVFSPRESEVLHLLCEGLSNDEIAATLNISPRTARGYCDALRLKLRAKRRRHIPRLYRELLGQRPDG